MMNRITTYLPVRSLAWVALATALSPLPALGDWAPATIDFSRAWLRDAEIAPSQPDRMIATCDGGALYRSEDGGLSWSNLTARIPIDAEPQEIAISPSNADLILVGIQGGEGPAGVLRSVDGGDSWTSIHDGLGGNSIKPLVFDPTDDSIVYAGTRTNGGGVYKSEDAGLTWSWLTSEFGSFSANALAINPSDSSSLLVGTSIGTLRSSDSGTTWTQTPDPRLRTISWSAANSDIVYGIDMADTIFKSTDGGATFFSLPNPDGDYAWHIAVSPHDAKHVFASALVFCQPVTYTAPLYRSFDGGDSWSIVFFPEDCRDEPNSLLFHPTDPNRIYLGTNGPNGFFASTNGGTDWTLSNDGFAVYSVNALGSDGAGTAYARGETVSLRATDPLGVWTSLDHPFVTGDTYPDEFDVNQAVPGLIYECGDAFPSDYSIDYLVTSSDSGGQWAPELGDLPEGIPGWSIRCVVGAWNNSRVYAFSNGVVYRSEDASLTYDPVHTGALFREAAVDPTNPDRIMAAHDGAEPVQYSTNGGVDWESRSAGLPVERPIVIEYDPANPAHISLVLQESGAYETTNSGLSWTPVFGTPDWIKDADWDPVTGHYYFAVRGVGVVTDDERVHDVGLPTRGIESICHADGLGALLVGTFRHGLYIYPLTTDPASIDPVVSEENKLVTLRTTPNPARGEVRISIEFASSQAAEATDGLDVYDARGRRIRELHSGPFHSLKEQRVWDGRDAVGNLVPAGIYWIRIRNGSGEDLRVKALVLR